MSVKKTWRLRYGDRGPWSNVTRSKAAIYRLVRSRQAEVELEMLRPHEVIVQVNEGQGFVVYERLDLTPDGLR